ncbi:MAG: tyrosine-protein phosphatase [Intrasporangiaceae bacterium]|nr:tyrosine-protein phosphatase [Intrasporangiaceae bacterium]
MPSYDGEVTSAKNPLDDIVGALHHGRWIEIDGVVNMRDLGGLPTADGGTIAPRRLIRSDNLQDLSPEAVDHLVTEIGVRDIVDLRSETELHVLGDGPLRRVESLAHHHHSLLPKRAVENRGPIKAPPAPGHANTAEGADVGLGSPWKKYDGRRDAEYWADHYLGYLSKRPDSVSAALDIVSRSSGATIVHCAAGKDRTGTVIALALSVAGVPDEVIIEDYVLTDERITRILGRLAAHPVYGEALKSQPVDDQRPKPESMVSILGSLHDGFGGASGWLREQGWSEDDLGRLRTRLRG